MLKNNYNGEITAKKRYNLLFSVNLIKKQYVKLNKWKCVYEIKRIINLLQVTKKNTQYYFNLPLNNQKTRTKQPVVHVKKWKFLVYLFTLKSRQMGQIYLSKNFVLFDYINRLWHRQWFNEWKKIRTRRLATKNLKKNKGGNINFPILQYKHIIRNFKSINKKKQKFLIHFNLGFCFFEYVVEKDRRRKFNKNIFKKKFGKYFLLKPRTQRYQNK